MVLMKKGDVYKFVADVHIESFRKDGFTVDGEAVDSKFEGQSKKLGCPHCGKEYATEATLNKHIAKDHKTNEE